MKKLALVLTFLLLAPFAFADDITLDSNEVLIVPTATRISEWEIIRISAASKILRVKYRWRAADDSLIKLERTGWNYWTCRNTYQGNNESCTALDTPWDCCSDLETGTCPEIVGTCFSDVFGFQIRTQDVGTSIGAGLRTLIWNKMKSDILTGGNDGDFD